MLVSMILLGNPLKGADLAFTRLWCADLITKTRQSECGPEAVAGTRH